MNLDRYWRESKREKERLGERKETGNQIPKTNMLVNVGEI